MVSVYMSTKDNEALNYLTLDPYQKNQVRLVVYMALIFIDTV